MIVNCAAYAGGRRVADIDLEAVSEYVAKHDHFVWIGLYEPSEEILKKIQEELGLHELAVEDAHRAHQRPKLEEYGAGLFVVLRPASLNSTDGTVDLGETHIFVGLRYVVTVRHGTAQGYADVRARVESTPRLDAHDLTAVRLLPVSPSGQDGNLAEKRAQHGAGVEVDDHR